MTRDTDTRPHFYRFYYKQVLGFNDRIAAALYDDQLFKYSTMFVGPFAVTPTCRLHSWP